MQKDIQWLKSKWWYRLLKVLYISFFGCLVIWILLVAIDINGPTQMINFQTSTLECLSGNKKVFTYEELSEKHYIFSFSESSISNEKIIELCELVRETHDWDTVNHSDVSERIQEMREWNNFVGNAYKLNEQEKTVGSWFLVQRDFFLATVVLLFIFEFIRRIFYYVLLGSFKPKKIT